MLTDVRPPKSASANGSFAFVEPRTIVESEDGAGGGVGGVLSFLQNMWARDPARVYAGIERYGETYRRRAIYYSLFAGCLTGRRLKAAFGDQVADIEWDEATREIASDSKRICKPQPGHIRATLVHYEPAIVLTFGGVASEAVAAIWTGPIIRAPHPAARQADVPQKLAQAAASLREFLAGRAAGGGVGGDSNQQTKPMNNTSIKSLLNEIESKWERELDAHAATLKEKNEEHEGWMIEKGLVKIYAAERDAALKVLAELNLRVNSGYDFNADPDSITLLVGCALRGERFPEGWAAGAGVWKCAPPAEKQMNRVINESES